MRKCGYCGGNKLKRVHRTFIERFSYLAIYECRDCEHEECVPRRYTYHLGDEARCPSCGTYRLSKLRGVDKIDKMATGLGNRIEKLLGGTLYHCVFCRLQFYDRRKAAPRTMVEPIAPHVVVEAIPPGGAAARRIAPAAELEPQSPTRPPRELEVRPMIAPPSETAPERPPEIDASSQFRRTASGRAEAASLQHRSGLYYPPQSLGIRNANPFS